jgi:hypothetical protein
LEAIDGLLPAISVQVATRATAAQHCSAAKGPSAESCKVNYTRSKSTQTAAPCKVADSAHALDNCRPSVSPVDPCSVLRLWLLWVS